MICNKKRQKISREGNASRVGKSQLPGDYSHDIAAVEYTRFRFGACTGAGHSRKCRAQWGFPGIYNQAGISQVGVPYGSWPAYGASPYGYGAFAGTGHAGPSNFIGFPQPGYSLSIGQRPLTTTSFQSVADVVTLAPSWGGSAHRLHRRYPARPNVPRVASR